jgi:hypothetical protein
MSQNTNQRGNFGIGNMSGGEIQSGAQVGGVINNEAAQGMNKDDVIELLTFIENAIQTRTDLPDDLKQKSMRYLGAATEEAKEPEPDKQLMSSSLKKVGSTIAEASKTVESAKDFAAKVAPTMLKLGAWLGTTLL